MSLLHAFLLGLLQGITEFLPISSSGHLVLAETFLKLDVEKLKDFDVMLHIGTLFAILIYFRREVFEVKRWPLLVLASIPAALVGIFLEDPMDSLFRNATSVSIAMIVMGLLFFIVPKKSEKPLTWARGLAIGCAQAFAIIPGVSRSGSTIWLGTQLGLKREEAARFSFLLGAIAIAGAGLLKSKDIWIDGAGSTLTFPVLAVGFAAAFLSSLFAVSWLMNFLKNHSLKAFGVYRVILGVSVLIVLALS
jgi:undecaprenyl-diphosphatase